MTLLYAVAGTAAFLLTASLVGLRLLEVGATPRGALIGGHGTAAVFVVTLIVLTRPVVAAALWVVIGVMLAGAVGGRLLRLRTRPEGT